MVKACDIVGQARQQEFLNVSLSRISVAERECELSTNLHEQLMKNGEYFIAYSHAVDERIVTHLILPSCTSSFVE